MKKHSILIVEDEKDLNSFLCEYMDIYFEKVYTAYDGEKALELYNNHKPDVIFTDINLPKLNGLDLAKQIRKEDKDTTIVILSAYTDQDKLFKAIELHLFKYLVKPIKSSDLEQTILNIRQHLADESIIKLSESTHFNLITNQLIKQNKEVKLTLQEKKFLSLLLHNKGVCVSYYEISTNLDEFNEFSKDSISSLVKRLRRKLDSNVITNCFNEGYKIL